MSIRTSLFSLATLAAIAAAASATAQDLPAPVMARQGQMQAMAINVGIVGNMARGNTEYDAEMAQAAANNLLALSQIDQRFHWPEGTDNFALEGTAALPAIWENPDGFAERYMTFGTAAQGLADVAGNGLDAMRAAVGPLGGSCGGCHDDFRQSN